MKYTDVVISLSKVSNKEKAKLLARFFKTGKGEYGYGDVFLGVVVPEQRKIAKQFVGLSLTELQKLFKSKIHEHRLTALLILVKQFEILHTPSACEISNDKVKEKIFSFYIKNIRYINNWDLVDLSAPNIVGKFLYNKQRNILYGLAKSSNLWERRIAILSTLSFIRQGDFKDTLKIGEMLLGDKEDLIHKAVGWMLREVGKKDEVILSKFLDKHIKNIPRTTLRYAIERFRENKRQIYLHRV
jgi:3-methyladenine DNA glycosylase AlkD